MSNSNSHTCKMPSSVAKFSEDMATLINNHQGSDVQFKVGGNSLQGNSEVILDELATETIYAHSIILRCRSPHFAALLDEQKGSLKKVIYMPRFSPGALKDVLHYIYTGNMPTKTTKNIIELIIAAKELKLEELALECKAELSRTINFYLSDEADSDGQQENPCIPIGQAVSSYIIPTLNVANSDSFSDIYSVLFTGMLPRISVIINSLDAYTAFVNGISSETLANIISSDDLVISERNVWNLVLGWGCHQTNLSKAGVEARLRSPEDDREHNDEGSAITETQLNQLKATLEPHLPAIRFSLLYSDDYTYIVDILNHFLPRRRFLELTRFFLNPDSATPLDEPRNGQKIPSTVLIVEPRTQKMLRKHIFETGGITGCQYSEYLKFELLFRASEDGFLASTFHQRCDNKGPTLVIAKSANERLFGGVNFSNWTSSKIWSTSSSNFLFALKDTNNLDDFTIFEIEESKAQYSAYSHSSYGPVFGRGYDLYISDSANNNQDSYSSLPNSYNGSEASNTALAGYYKFKLLDYEVFAISKQRWL